MKFIFPRTRTVASVYGQCIEFKKGEPTHVPPMMFKEVIAAGGVPEDEIPEDELPRKEEPTGPDREALIRAAMEDMVANHVREEFTAGGAPHTKALQKRLGFAVTNQERDAAWLALKQA